MLKFVKSLMAFAVVGVLSSCAAADRYGAAGDVHALLLAIRDDDQATFESHIDRRAIDARLQEEMVRRARTAHLSPGLTLLGAWFSGFFFFFFGDVLVQPEVFRDVAAYYGYGANTPIPNRMSLAAALTGRPDGRVCATARRNGPCLLTFANERGVWRLVDFDAAASLGGGRYP